VEDAQKEERESREKLAARWPQLEQFPKSVKRFSDKNCGKNKALEQERDSEIAHSALVPLPRSCRLRSGSQRQIHLSRFTSVWIGLYRYDRTATAPRLSVLSRDVIFEF